jgi:hypothetical protein
MFLKGSDQNSFGVTGFGVICFGFIFAIRLKRGTVDVLPVSTFRGVGRRRRFCATLLPWSVVVFFCAGGRGRGGVGGGDNETIKKNQKKILEKRLVW